MFWELATCFSNRHTFVSIDQSISVDQSVVSCCLMTASGTCLSVAST